MRHKTLVALVTLCFLGCIKQPQPIPNNIVVGVDLSGSRDSLALAFYQAVITQVVLPKLGERDRITVIPIDNGSQTASEEIFSKDFSQDNYKNELAGFAAAESERRWHKDSINAAAQRFVQYYEKAIVERQRLKNGTDIVGALVVARKYFRRDAHNLVLLLADMQQCLGTIDFGKSLTQAQVDGYQSQFQVTDLSEVDVDVLTGKQESVAVDKYLRTQEFWLRYIERCKGKVIDYSSGSTARLLEWFNNNSAAYE